jgi:hypothetical protein
LIHRRRVAGGEAGDGVEQDAEDEHAAAPEDVGEVAAEQPEDAAGDGRPVEEVADPGVDGRVGRRDVQQLRQRGTHDERQHQQYVGVEREADGRGDADGPLDQRQR